ncbi:probable glucosamine 6-phosphate N-acetyltransferase isoform X2 [Zootermopsis nevadensis]|uniref:probable glucosamine 6-phosphate N-acetyltransferase isoform X2 n=1 Tax=Zootermopsis nevadensis TaxID=136037 RepID=UPI000B8EB6F7|nr:probable glucosamine 6-phosphate N-acetyltransferase isoform X2 [Zootermopsis nevadensis]
MMSISIVGLQNAALSSEPLYNPDLLRLDFSQIKTKFDPPISPSEPGEALIVRPLCPADYDKGFVQLLSQLTKVGNISKDQFLRRYTTMKACPNTYYVTVIEDTRSSHIVGSATLIVEQKFIHECAVRGRLEDVVVSDDYRGKQLGKLIIMTITLLAQHLNCYKITLDCKDRMIPLYTGLGYKLEQGGSNYMQIRFDNKKPFKL